MARVALYILIGSWAVFSVYWVARWFSVKRTVERQSAASKLTVAVPTMIGAFLIISSRGSRLLPNSDLIYAIGSMTSITGLAITIWARRTLGTNWSANVTFKEGHELIQSGPYRFVRHPIYTGFLLMVLAVAIVNGRSRALVGAGFVILGFWYKLREEETLMARHFPDAYPAYRKRVKALIPWLLLYLS